MRMWYDKPAEKWIDALPVGNGSIGAMVFGRTEEEVIQFNEESIWSGSLLSRENKDARKVLPEIRTFLKKGMTEEAERLALYGFSGTPNSERAYQTAGEIYLSFQNQGDVKEYTRELDLEKGSVIVRYQCGDVVVRREIFASYPDKVIVIYLAAEGEGTLDFACHMERAHNQVNEIFADETTIGFFADSGEKGIHFCALLSEEHVGGTVRNIGEHLVFSRVREAVLLLSVTTDYRENDYFDSCQYVLNQAKKQGIQTLRERHQRDYTALFQRLELRLEQIGDCENIPVDSRLERIRQGKEDPNLFVLYFQYARYLLISSSRKDCLPANLQGIWNHELMPAWDSKYTLNINLEMNYWMAEMANLSECHMPLFELTERMKERGKVTAKKMYGCEGSVAHHNTDLYADTAPQDYYLPATYWVMGEAWLSTHIWEHYLYTKDINFLEQYFDVLHQSVLFFEQFLCRNDQGKYVVIPSLSPENTYITHENKPACLCCGATMDTQILKELFGDYIEACFVLGKEEYIPAAREVYDNLPQYQIGKYGQLQEWMEDYEEAEPGHRHLSHLFAVCPGKTINYRDTKTYMDAAKTALFRRLQSGGGHTGWSMAWIICLLAHFKEKEQLYHCLEKQLTDNTACSLLNTHPMEQEVVFQIDGNFGTAAGMLYMLVQCYRGRVELLPSLPDQFANGKVKGIRIYGNAELEMEWQNKKVVRYSIHAFDDYETDVYYDDTYEHIVLKKGQQFYWERNEGKV